MRSKPRKGIKPKSPISPQQETPNVAMELELLALKAKNADIIKDNIKLRQVIDEQRRQMSLQQEDLYIARTEANTYKLELSKIREDFKTCTPYVVKIMNMFIKNLNDRNNSDLLNMSNLLSNSDSTEHAKVGGAITQAVKPHIVNGTVLNVNPTISLTRLNPSLESDRPSTSFGEPSVEVPTRNNFNQHIVEDSSDVSDSDIDWVVEENLHTDSLSEPQFRRKLSNILEGVEDGDQEEERTLVRTQRSSEIRILLPRLSDSNSTNDLPNITRTSIEGNIGDNTNYNFETTIIEDSAMPKRRDRVRLISDYVMSSPRASSSMLRMSETAMIGDIRILLPRLSDANSPSDLPNMTGASIDGNIGDNTNYDFETTLIENAAISKRGDRVRMISDYVVSSPRASSTLLRVSDTGLVENTSPSWLMPSTTIGDIEGSQMENIFADLRMNEVSPEEAPPSMITKRKAYSEQESPKSSRQEKSLKSSLPHSFASVRSKKEFIALLPHAVPKVILERLSTSALTVPPSPRRTRSGSRQNAENADPSEHNNNNNNNCAPKKMEEKPKRKKKRKKSDDEGVTEMVREMQVRLSNYSFSQTECPVQQTPASSGRPPRAARPSNLVECSRKVKMRRMF